MPQPKKKVSLSKENKELTAITEKAITKPKPKDGIYVDKQGVASVLAKMSRIGSKMNSKAVSFAKTAAYVIENGEKRELTTKEASAFVRSGWTNPPR